MGELKEKTIVAAYMKEKAAGMAGYLFLLLVFWIVAGLYGYDEGVQNMSYAALLAGFFGLCAYGIGYGSYRKKVRQLYDAFLRMGESDCFLPSPKGLTEQLYYDMVCRTEEDKRQLISELDEKKADMADYYTMWIHQIKTPIAALKLIQQRMTEETSTERIAEDQKQSAEELFKIEKYAEMALHYARLDSMSGDMLFKTYDIAAIIKQAVKKYFILFMGSGLSFSMEEFTCRAVTDEKWLMFVVEQILSNALKYTQEGGIRIYGADKGGRELTNRKAGQIRVSYVVIEDTGIGIRSGDLPRIFERGFTGYNGRMGKKSTGIGLYLSREIMKRLSHQIRVESEEGKGTKVILGFEQEGLQ